METAFAGKTKEIVTAIRKGGHEKVPTLILGWLTEAEKQMAIAVQKGMKSQDMAKFFGKVLKAQEQGDFVLLADILEYEAPDML